jgi:S1-C subfamily serine protease
MATDGTPLASHDAAFATIDADAFALLGTRMALPSALRTPDRVGETVYFWGATSGVVQRTVIHDLDASVTMRCRIFTSVGPSSNFSSVNVPMSGLIQCDAQPPVLGGDSGCLLFDGNGCALGILIGTDPANVYPYFSPLAPILDLFGLSLVTVSEVEGAASLVDSIAG